VIGSPRRIAGYLKKELELTADQEEVALYSLEIIIYGFLTFLAVGVVDWLLGCRGAALIVLSTIIFLRSFSGGGHSDNPFSCIVASVILTALSGKLAILTAPLLSNYLLVVLIIFGFGLSFFLNWRLAPVNSPAKPLASESGRRRFWVLSWATVILVFMIQVGLLYFIPLNKSAAAILAMEAGLLWQAFSLTEAGHRFFALTNYLNFKN